MLQSLLSIAPNLNNNPFSALLKIEALKIALAIASSLNNDPFSIPLKIEGLKLILVVPPTIHKMKESSSKPFTRSPNSSGSFLILAKLINLSIRKLWSCLRHLEEISEASECSLP